MANYVDRVLKCFDAGKRDCNAWGRDIHDSSRVNRLFSSPRNGGRALFSYNTRHPIAYRDHDGHIYILSPVGPEVKFFRGRGYSPSIENFESKTTAMHVREVADHYRVASWEQSSTGSNPDVACVKDWRAMRQLVEGGRLPDDGIVNCPNTGRYGSKPKWFGKQTAEPRSFFQGATRGASRKQPPRRRTPKW